MQALSMVYKNTRRCTLRPLQKGVEEDEAEEVAADYFYPPPAGGPAHLLLGAFKFESQLGPGQHLTEDSAARTV